MSLLGKGIWKRKIVSALLILGMVISIMPQMNRVPTFAETESSVSESEDYVNISYNLNGGYTWEYQWNEETSKYEMIKNFDVYTWSGNKGITGYPSYYISEPLIDDPHKIFGGWSDTPDGEAINYEITFDTDRTFYAIWDDAVVITHNANGGYFLEDVWDDESGDWVDQQSMTYTHRVKKGSTSWLPGSTGGNLLIDDERKEFAGWSLTPDGEVIDDYYTFNEDETFYAKWRDIVNLSFDPNGGYYKEWEWNDEIGQGIYVNKTEVRNITAEKGSSWYLPNFFGAPENDEGQIFVGWSTSPDGEPIESEYTFDTDQTFYAIWADSVTVTYDANGGYYLNSVWDDESGDWVEKRFTGYTSKVKAGTVRWPYPDIDVYNDENKRLLGWSLTPDGEVINDDYTFDKDLTFYAKWVDTVTILFDPNGGYSKEWVWDDSVEGWVLIDSETVKSTTVDKGTVDYPSNRTAIPENEDPGKVFVGWSTAPDGEPIEGEYTFDTDQTFYAIWSDAVTVTYDFNGGYVVYNEWDEETYSWVDNEYTSRSINLKKGASSWPSDYMSSPQIRDEHKGFLGWSLTPDGDIVDYEYTFDKDVTFYAKWIDTVNLSFDPNGGYYKEWEWNDEIGQGIYVNKTEARNTTAEKGSSWYLPSFFGGPENDGAKVFVGWSTSPDGEPIWDDYTFDTDQTFYAIWGDAVTVKYDPYYGYFNSWSWDSDLEQDVLVKDYSIRTQLIALGNHGNPQEYCEAPRSEDPDIVFCGWALEPEGEPISETYYFDSDVTFYAVWAKKIVVTLDANGGVFSHIYDDNNNYLEEESAVSKWGLNSRNNNTFMNVMWTVPKYVDSTRAFNYWATDPEGTNIISENYPITENITLYAVWDESVLVTFDAGDGYFTYYYDELNQWKNEPSSKSYYCQKKGVQQWLSNITPGEPISNNAGKIFAGWSLSPDSNTTINYYTFNEPLTLYAVWVDKVVATFDANGGYFSEGTYDENGIWIDGQATVSKRGFVKGSTYIVSTNLSEPRNDDTSKAFAGWALSPDGEVIKDPYIYDDNVTFYAIWTDKIVITFVGNSGYFEGSYDENNNWISGETTTSYRGVSAGANYYMGNITPYPENVNDNKEFVGWSLDPNDKSYYASSNNSTIISSWDTITFDEPATYYAIWANKVTVTYDANGGTFSETGSTIIVALEREGSWLSNYRYNPINGSNWIAGWSTDKTKAGIINDIPATDTTLYAVWIEMKAITFEGNGMYLHYGKGGSEKLSQLLEKGQALAGYVPQAYAIIDEEKVPMDIYWAYDAEGKNPVDNVSELILNEDTTLYAIAIAPKENFVLGDVNGDGSVSADDMTALARHVAKISVITDETRLKASDVNRDAGVDANDLTMLARYVARIITSFE